MITVQNPTSRRKCTGLHTYTHSGSSSGTCLHTYTHSGSSSGIGTNGLRDSTKGWRLNCKHTLRPGTQIWTLHLTCCRYDAEVHGILLLIMCFAMYTLPELGTQIWTLHLTCCRYNAEVYGILLLIMCCAMYALPELGTVMICIACLLPQSALRVY